MPKKLLTSASDRSPFLSPKSKHHYSAIPNQTLFITDGNGVTVISGDLTNINQGSAGDCYFLASLMAVASRSQDAIKQLVRENDDGSYSGTFHGLLRGQRGIFEARVSGDLPTKKNGRVANNRVETVNGKTVSWAAIIEKLWAAVNGNSYSAIDGIGDDTPENDHDIHNALYALTGSEPVERPVSSLTFSQLEHDLTQGAVVVGTGRRSGVLGARHALAVLETGPGQTVKVGDPSGKITTIGFLELVGSNVNQYFTVALLRS